MTTTSLRVTTATTSTTWSSSGVGSTKKNNNSNNNSNSKPKLTVDEVDAYAQSVLEQAALDAAAMAHESEPCWIDASLGPYVTSCLRNAHAVFSAPAHTNATATAAFQDVTDVTSIPDFESLCELVQEHCRMEEEDAVHALKRIAKAVFSGRVPTASDISRIDVSVSSLAETDFRSLTLALSTEDMQIIAADQEPELQPQAIVSPIAVGDLLPIALLEEDEEDDDDDDDDNCIQLNQQQQEQQPAQASPTSTPPPRVAALSMSSTGSSPPNDETAFPRLDSSSTSSSKTSHRKTKHPPPAPRTTATSISSSSAAGGGGGSTSSTTSSGHHGKYEKSASADELAAVLFRPSSRSRQSSIDETSPNQHHHHHHAVTALSQPPSSSSSVAIPKDQPSRMAATTPTPTNPYFTLNQNNPHPHYSTSSSSSIEQQQHQQDLVHCTAEVLLSMNSDLSSEAAYEASLLAGANVHVAQYVIKQAMAQMPVCRHLLADGCYRADCSFSHDIDSHTCLFWMRSSSRNSSSNSSSANHYFASSICDKGAQCRFLHGFAPLLLDHVPEHLYADQQQQEQQLPPQIQLQTYDYSDYNYHNHNSNNHEYGHHEYGTYGNAVPPPPTRSLWIPSPPPSLSSSTANSFANIAFQGYDTRQSFGNSDTGHASSSSSTRLTPVLPVVTIPHDLWNPHENRDATAFYIADPLERYYAVNNVIAQPRDDVIDLHFQSLQTFRVVLETVLPRKLRTQSHVWIVTGTGHHVNSRRTHQKSGGTLEAAVLEYLIAADDVYTVSRGRDRNGQGGAVLVQRKPQPHWPVSSSPSSSLRR